MKRSPSAKRYRDAIFKRDMWTCIYCKVRVHRRDPRHAHYATIDHIIPRSEGGMSVDENMATACKSCNQKKGRKSADAYTAMIQAGEIKP